MTPTEKAKISKSAISDADKELIYKAHRAMEDARLKLPFVLDVFSNLMRNPDAINAVALSAIVDMRTLLGPLVHLGNTLNTARVLSGMSERSADWDLTIESLENQISICEKFNETNVNQFIGNYGMDPKE